MADDTDSLGGRSGDSLPSLPELPPPKTVPLVVESFNSIKEAAVIFSEATEEFTYTVEDDNNYTREKIAQDAQNSAKTTEQLKKDRAAILKQIKELQSKGAITQDQFNKKYGDTRTPGERFVDNTKTAVNQGNNFFYNLPAFSNFIGGKILGGIGKLIDKRALGSDKSQELEGKYAELSQINKDIRSAESAGVEAVSTDGFGGIGGQGAGSEDGAILMQILSGLGAINSNVETVNNSIQLVGIVLTDLQDRFNAFTERIDEVLTPANDFLVTPEATPWEPFLADMMGGSSSPLLPKVKGGEDTSEAETPGFKFTLAIALDPGTTAAIIMIAVAVIAIAAAIIVAVALLKDGILDVLHSVADTLIMLSEAVVAVVTDVVIPILQTIGDIIQGLGEVFIQVIQSVVVPILTSIPNLIVNVVGGLAKVITAPLTLIAKVIETISEGLVSVISGVFGLILTFQDAMEKYVAPIAEAVAGVILTSLEGLSNVLEAFSNLGVTFFDSLTHFIEIGNRILDAIGDGLITIINSIAGVVDSFCRFLQNPLGNIASTAGSVISGIGNGISSAVSTVSSWFGGGGDSSSEITDYSTASAESVASTINKYEKDAVHNTTNNYITNNYTAINASSAFSSFSLQGA